ncbi:MAG: ABC transporter substrate-binding protein, partial [Rivularia sp. (in: cyanobacteria)]
LKGQVVKIDLLNKSNSYINLIKKHNPDIIVLLPDTQTLPNALEVVKANKGNLPVLAGDDVYSSTTLKEGKEKAKGMIVAVPWDIDLHRETRFVKGSKDIWGERDVNWRTAMSYDATKALIAAIKKNPTREGVAQVLRSNNFQIDKDKLATGEVKFSDNGDRQNPKIQLVKIESDPKSKYGYDFKPIP